MEETTTPHVTIPHVGEVPMDNLSHFLGILVNYVDLHRDLVRRFYEAKSIMDKGLHVDNLMPEHSELINGCQNVYDCVETELREKAFDEVISLVDSIRR